jgi:hypothetical protein
VQPGKIGLDKNKAIGWCVREGQVTVPLLKNKNIIYISVYDERCSSFAQ